MSKYSDEVATFIVQLDSAVDLDEIKTLKAASDARFADLVREDIAALVKAANDAEVLALQAKIAALQIGAK